MSNGCLSAWTRDNVLVGRSAPLTLRRSKRALSGRDFSVSMNNASRIDAEGPWFDGVAALKGAPPGAVNSAAIKKKKIAIVGAGMSGLMTYLNLHNSGFTNLEIIEASERLGGRVHTSYFSPNPFDYEYQEMGPMRFPKSIRYADTNETLIINDHHIVFQLAEALNEINKDKALAVNFIPWYQASPNGLSYYNEIRKPDGTVPTLTEVQNNASLSLPTVDDPILDEAKKKIASITNDREFMREMGANVYRAHKTWLDTGLNGLGGDDWSEFAYLHNYLKYTLNVTDQAIGSGGDGSFWGSLYDSVYFSATDWATIDGGLTRLPQAFHPLVDKVTRMNREVFRMDYLAKKDGKVKLSWTEGDRSKVKHDMYDYAVVAVPFSVVRRWRLPHFSPTLKSAITNMPYEGSCKVALQFSTRFWESLAQPIYGSCSTTTDIPGIGSICYPSYNINGTGPGVMLASYSSGDWGERWLSWSEEEHVQYVLNAIIEIHGDVAREQYTGKYDRVCWDLDKHQSGAWANPSIGQHRLYIPSFFNTENNVIFVGEHTSYTHAWIAAALESGVRGSVQLLLELGLVDEAKAVNEKWMARWINV